MYLHSQCVKFLHSFSHQNTDLLHIDCVNSQPAIRWFFQTKNQKKEVQMNKILKLICDEYHNQRPSAEYRLAQKVVCEAQAKFMAGLSTKQKKEFMELDFIQGQLNVQSQNDFAEYLFSAFAINRQ